MLAICKGNTAPCPSVHSESTFLGKRQFSRHLFLTPHSQARPCPNLNTSLRLHRIISPRTHSRVIAAIPHLNFRRITPRRHTIRVTRSSISSSSTSRLSNNSISNNTMHLRLSSRSTCNSLGARADFNRGLIPGIGAAVPSPSQCAWRCC